jgi:hypothetical protein
MDVSLRAQWAGLLLAPAAFFAHLQIGYVLVPRACRHHQDVWLHVVGVASVLLAAVGLAIAWRVWQATHDAPGDAGGPAPRARFLGATRLGVSALLVLLLVAQWVAAFFISPCQ